MHGRLPAITTLNYVKLHSYQNAVTCSSTLLSNLLLLYLSQAALSLPLHPLYSVCPLYNVCLAHVLTSVYCTHTRLTKIISMQGRAEGLGMRLRETSAIFSLCACFACSPLQFNTLCMCACLRFMTLRAYMLPNNTYSFLFLGTSY